MSTKMKVLSGLIAGIAILSAAAAALFTPNAVSAASLERRGGPGGWGSPVPGSQPAAGQYAALPAATPLSEAEKEGLRDAILEEYGALNLYSGIIADFGTIAPFAQIARSEQQHVNALLRLAEKYGVEVPANPGLASDPKFATLASACSVGAAAEIADAALYDELKVFTTHSDLLQVYANLQRASLNSHLPAFQACD
jgi:hypothetical protein